MSIQINTGFKIAHFAVDDKKNVCPKNGANDKIQLSPPVIPGVLNTYFFYQSAIVMSLYQIFLHFWIIFLENAHNFDLLN